MAWQAVPIATPFAWALRIFISEKIKLPNIAPSTPIKITMAAAKEGMPPSDSVTNKVMGVVTDKLAKDALNCAGAAKK